MQLIYFENFWVGLSLKNFYWNRYWNPIEIISEIKFWKTETLFFRPPPREGEESPVRGGDGKRKNMIKTVKLLMRELFFVFKIVNFVQYLVNFLTKFVNFLHVCRYLIGIIIEFGKSVQSSGFPNF